MYNPFKRKLSVPLAVGAVGAATATIGGALVASVPTGAPLTTTMTISSPGIVPVMISTSTPWGSVLTLGKILVVGGIVVFVAGIAVGIRDGMREEKYKQLNKVT